MTSYDSRPIGVFDSGLGGLTVVKELIRTFPKESIVYLGDTARVPYGTRSVETIKEFAKHDVEFLLSKNVKAIVVACNTVSAVALDEVKKLSSVPVFEVITPAVESATRAHKKNMCVIGTLATISSNIYFQKLHKLQKDLQITQKATPLLVPLVEEGILDGPILDEVMQYYLGDMDFDVLVLGCTHYPLLARFIQQKYPHITIINSGECVAAKMESFITSSPSAENKKNEHKYFFTDISPKTLEIAQSFLENDISQDVHKVHFL